MIQRFAVIVLVALALGCSAGPPPQTTAPASAPAPAPERTLILGAYTTPREAYGKLIPLFQEKWLQSSNEKVVFQESYLGSGAQSRAILEGFEADIAALSLEADVTRIAEAGLITHDWKAGATRGIVSTSVVVFALRPGNPKGIKDWADLAKPGLEILTPNPKTSGGAMWNILSLYGAALRGKVEGVPANDEKAATAFLKKVIKNVTVWDKGARESITNFENGVGDIAITYENEVLVARKHGKTYDMVIPRSSILIQNPIAVVDSYVEKHGTRSAAEAFVAFCLSKEAQEIFADHGLRSVDPEVAKATAASYPALEDVFTIDFFGGWPEATKKFFAEDGVFPKAQAEVFAR